MSYHFQKICLLHISCSDVAETAVMGFTQPTVLMKITDESSDRTGEILTRAAVGDVVRLHMWVNEAFTGV